MHVKKVALKLEEIKKLVDEIRETPISQKVVSKEKQQEMFCRIADVFDRYDEAIENDIAYLPLIRKELNQIIFILKRWIEYDEIYFSEYIQKIGSFL